MKKIFYILASAIVALGAVACNNELDENINANTSVDGIALRATIDEATRVTIADRVDGKHAISLDQTDVLVGYGVKAGVAGATSYEFTYNAENQLFECINREIRKDLLEGGYYRYDIVTPTGVIEGCTLGIPGWVNIENSVAAVALLWSVERDIKDHDALRKALKEFSGVKRRFEFYVNTPNAVYMDDYAHHPRELAATITSVKQMLPERKVTAIFQPHLYTRTRDLYEEFAEALNEADEVVLLPIYPAREKPIAGVTSEWLMEKVLTKRALVLPEILAEYLSERVNVCLNHNKKCVVITMGAGDIDRRVSEIKEALQI